MSIFAGPSNLSALLLATALCPRGADAQSELSRQVRSFVAVDAPVVAFVNARVIDGTGAPEVSGRAPASGAALDAMVSDARESYLRRRAQIAVAAGSPWERLFPKIMAMEKAFADAGGTLLVGTDPTGYGGVVAGDPSTRIEYIRRVELVFKGGVGYDSAKLIESARGTVGIR